MSDPLAKAKILLDQQRARDNAVRRGRWLDLVVQSVPEASTPRYTLHTKGVLIFVINNPQFLGIFVKVNICHKKMLWGGVCCVVQQHNRLLFFFLPHPMAFAKSVVLAT